MSGMGNGERDNTLRDQTASSASEFWAKNKNFEEFSSSRMIEDLNTAYGVEPVEEIATPSFHLFETLLDEAHPSSKKFYDLLIEAALLHAKKQKDYGSVKDPFANVRASEEWGIPSWIGACVRLNDKVRRLQTLSTKGSLVNESVRDSFMDICVYALIGLVMYEEQA
jgi:hypothetical protein